MAGGARGMRASLPCSSETCELGISDGLILDEEQNLL